VNGNMYVFGGKGAGGSYLGDLGIFMITQQRWDILRDIGPSPSPRSGHAMAVVGTRILVLGGRLPASRTNEDYSVVRVLVTKRSECAIQAAIRPAMD